MKILLATSPHVRHAAVLQSDFTPASEVMYTFAPLGLMSLAASLRQESPEIECGIYDLNRQIVTGAVPLGADFYAALARDLVSVSPDLVGFMTECDSYHHVLQICAQVKKRRPECHVVLGGPHASAVARETLERCQAVDAIVIGEGDVTFRELVAGLGTDACIAGTVSRLPDGTIIQGAVRPLIENLDHLPIPAFDLYRPDAGEEMFIEVGRGCPFQCEFCSTAPYWNRRHRVKSPARILEEIGTVRRLFGTERVHFTHDLFTTNRSWVRSVCEALIAAGAPVAWTCSARTDTVDEDLLRLMKRAGCSAIYFGLESGSPRILREIRKDIPPDHSVRMLSVCRQQGITPNGGFIVGFPSEDNASLRDTLSAYERVLRLGCRPAHIFAFCPFADAAIYRSLERLTCTGHFVDLPLGVETDERNRALVASDPVLYGSYFRPDLPGLVPDEPLALAALDEFSSLVEATLAPTLALCEISGGMYEVFSRWLGWVRRDNLSRGAAWYRMGYGTAAKFARFLVEELVENEHTRPSMLAVARAIETNLRVAEAARLQEATTMASYRSFARPDMSELSEFALKTRLVRGPVLATLALEFDVTPALAGRFDEEIAAQATYLAWQITAERTVRLIHIDRTVFEALETLSGRSATVGELLLNSFGRSSSSSAALGLAPDDVIESLQGAAREGLFAVETTQHVNH